MRQTILVTGFGPFPGMPFNPTAALVQRLGRMRRPAFAQVRLVAHVFPTRYGAVDADLPALLARHRPDAVLMFGVAGRAKALRIETLARNRITALLPDAGGARHVKRTIAAEGPATMRLPFPAQRLLRAAKDAGVPARLSRDAGRYLCNYLCWRTAEVAAAPGGPRIAAFVHVPKLDRVPRRPRARNRHRFTLDDLVRAGAVLLRETQIAASRR